LRPKNRGLSRISDSGSAVMKRPQQLCSCEGERKKS
jgi:hypothetical protein